MDCIALLVDIQILIHSGILSYLIQKQMNEKNEVILFNPFYETDGSIRQNFSIGHIHKDEFQYKSDILLIIADSLNQYFGKVPITEFRERLVKYDIEKRKDGISILSNLGSFLKCCIKN